MASPWTMPALGASLLSAVALGVHLGESAVGLINPVHFQGPALHPRDRGAAIDPHQPRPSGPVYASLYGWEEGRTARAADCGDCEALKARDAHARAYSARVPHFGSDEEIRALERRARAAIETRHAEAEAEMAAAAAEREARRESMMRYASYPIQAQESRYPDYKARDVYLDDADAGDRYE